MKRAISVLTALIMALSLFSGCSASTSETGKSPDGGAEFGALKQRAEDLGYLTFDAIDTQPGDKLPKIVGGFALAFEDKENSTDLTINVLEFEYDNYARQYATSLGDAGSGDTCRTSGRFAAVYSPTGGFESDEAVAVFLNALFEKTDAK